MSATRTVLAPTPSGERREAEVVSREWDPDIKHAAELLTVEIDGYRYRVPADAVTRHE